MTIERACDIKGCLKTARIVHGEYKPDRYFYICQDCQTAVVLDTLIAIDEEWSQAMIMEMAARVNAWFRQRRGVAIPHKSGVVTTTKYLGPAIITGGNG